MDERGDNLLAAEMRRVTTDLGIAAFISGR